MGRKIAVSGFSFLYLMGLRYSHGWDIFFYSKDGLKVTREIFAKQGLYYVNRIHHGPNIMHSKKQYHHAGAGDSACPGRHFLRDRDAAGAAGIGTFGALIVCALHRRLTWVALYDASLATLKATAMVMWIFFGATMFVGFFIVKGGQTFVSAMILGTGLPPYGILLLMMAVPSRAA